MIKRWKVSFEFMTALYAIWAIGWIPIYFLVVALFTPCDPHGRCGFHSNLHGIQPYHIFLMVWFGVVLIPAAIYGLIWGVKFTWRNRPQRIVEPLTEDLRDQE